MLLVLENVPELKRNTMTTSATIMSMVIPVEPRYFIWYMPQSIALQTAMFLSHIRKTETGLDRVHTSGLYEWPAPYLRAIYSEILV